MNLLGIDIGSSSVKAGVLRNGKLLGEPARASFPTRYEGVKAEVDAPAVLKAVAAVIREVGTPAKRVDVIGLSVMSPSWIAMDKSGKPLTPIVTHQDRRSVDIAIEIENRVGKEQHLQIAGNRPFPGGISSTTFAWYLRNEPALMRKADLVGHLNTFVHRQMTGARVVDPSNASFMGLYRTCDLSGWSDLLCEAIGADKRLLPEVRFANAIGGSITRQAAGRFHLAAGTPMMVGLVDTGAAMLLPGAEPGQLMNVTGSTDVLILCTDRPHPHEKLLTRALGIPERWTSVATIAAAGSALNWAQEQFFADLSMSAYHRLLSRLANHPLESSVRFEPYLAGERASIEQKTAAFTGLTLAITRMHMLSAMIESLAAASAARFPLLKETGVRMRTQVVVSGGMQGELHKILHRDWPGRWQFKIEKEASLRGLARLDPAE
jgi:xylulokinase